MSTIEQGAVSWICGLMAENTDALGFIPSTTVAQRYVRHTRFILQDNERGRHVGYILYGALQYARPVTVAQHCIQYESRLRGYGEAAVAELERRAVYVGCPAIKLRCADDNPGAVAFWQNCGFVARNVVPGGVRRQRQIIEMIKLLPIPILEGTA